MANVKNDDAETLDFADEGEYIDDNDPDDEPDTNTWAAGAAWREGDDL